MFAVIVRFVKFFQVCYQILRMIWMLKIMKVRKEPNTIRYENRTYCSKFQFFYHNCPHFHTNFIMFAPTVCLGDQITSFKNWGYSCGKLTVGQIFSSLLSNFDVWSERQKSWKYETNRTMTIRTVRKSYILLKISVFLS